MQFVDAGCLDACARRPDWGTGSTFVVSYPASATRAEMMELNGQPRNELAVLLSNSRLCRLGTAAARRRELRLLLSFSL